MNKPLIIYIAGFRQHAGKTVTSLGIISALKKIIPIEQIGYIKPVGQELVTLDDGRKIDKDAKIIESFSKIPDLDMAMVSPVRIQSGFTKQFLMDPDPDKCSREMAASIQEAFASLSHKKVIIAEGTGHPGVGGMFELNNSQVAKMMNAQVIYLSAGGIGRALDQLEVDLCFFLYHKTPVRGIIFNKVIPKKIENMRSYITEDLLNHNYPEFPSPLRIFGFLPEIDDLPRPSMRVITAAFADQVEILGDPQQQSWERPCGRIRIIALPDESLDLSEHTSQGDLIIIGASSYRRLKRLIEWALSRKKENRYCGFILTCGKMAQIHPDMRELIAKTEIPTIKVNLDTAEVETVIMSTFRNSKLQPFDYQKYQEIEELFDQHFDLDKFLHCFPEITGN